MANDKKDEHVITQRCSFCKREVEIHDSLDMPIYDPATGFGICKNCIKELAHYIELHEEDTAKKRSRTSPPSSTRSSRRTSRTSSSSTSMSTSSTRTARRRSSPSPSTTTTSA